MQYLNVQDERIESVCLRADRLIGNVTSRNLFTGYGLFYKKEFMFALWLNGKFYLQAKNELAQQLMRSGCSPFTTNEVNRRFVLADYYRLSSNMIITDCLLILWGMSRYCVNYLCFLLSKSKREEMRLHYLKRIA